MDLYISIKRVFQEFVSAHREVNVMNVAEVVSKLNVFSILIDRPTIHGKRKECVFLQWFPRKEFINGRNTIVT